MVNFFFFFLDIVDMANSKKKGKSNNPHPGLQSRKIAIAELHNVSLLTNNQKGVRNPTTLATTP